MPLEPGFLVNNYKRMDLKGYLKCIEGKVLSACSFCGIFGINPGFVCKCLLYFNFFTIAFMVHFEIDLKSFRHPNQTLEHEKNRLSCRLSVVTHDNRNTTENTKKSVVKDETTTENKVFFGYGKIINA